MKKCVRGSLHALTFEVLVPQRCLSRGICKFYFMINNMVKRDFQNYFPVKLFVHFAKYVKAHCTKCKCNKVPNLCTFYAWLYEQKTFQKVLFSFKVTCWILLKNLKNVFRAHCTKKVNAPRCP